MSASTKQAKAFPSREEQVNPTDIGGQFKVIKPSNTLFSTTFETRTVPVVSLDSIIVAVCGPNDFADNAGPTADGWFYSDFYLFYHLLKGTTSQQHWLTCIRPEDYVKKYTELLHGDPTEERRIVLNKDLLPAVEGVRYVPDIDLGQCFLSCISDAAKETRGTERQILILMFGHGQEGSYGITIGGNRCFESCPIYKPRDVAQAMTRHNPNPLASLLTTSCYGGGWCLSTNPNVTALSGVSDEQELISWLASASLKRYCGSRFTTAVVEAVCQLEAATSEDVLRDLQEAPTYAALYKSVQDILRDEIDVQHQFNRPFFSAQDDLWESDYRERSGFPLSSFEAKYNQLKSVPKATATSLSQLAGSRVTWFNDASVSQPIAVHHLKRLASIYLSTDPGRDDAAPNIFLHSRCRDLLKTPPRFSYTSETLSRLAKTLRYRMQTTARATLMKDLLRSSYFDCEDTGSNAEYQHIRATGRSEDVSRLGEIYGLVVSCKPQLFPSPLDGEGHPFSKVTYYLSLVFHKTGWVMPHIKMAIDELIALNPTHIQAKFTAESLRLKHRDNIRGVLRDTVVFLKCPGDSFE